MASMAAAGSAPARRPWLRSLAAATGSPRVLAMMKARIASHPPERFFAVAATLTNAPPRNKRGRSAADRGIKSKKQDQSDQRADRGARIGDGAAAPLGSISAGVEPGLDHRGFELGGRAEAAGQRIAGTFGIALEHKHVGAEPRWNPRTRHALFYHRIGKRAVASHAVAERFRPGRVRSACGRLL